MGDVLDLLGPLEAIFSPSAGRLYASLFRKSIKSRNVMVGCMAHAHLAKSGLCSEPLVSNVLLNVYAKAGRLGDAGKLFDEMPVKDMVSWCTLISGYVLCGLEFEAFGILRKVYRLGLLPNQFIISVILRGCSNSEHPSMGMQVHAAALKLGVILDSYVEVGLISMYSKQGAMAVAMKLFYEVPVKCLASWNAMISGHARQGLFAEAADLSRDLCRAGFVMDLVALRVVAAAAAASGLIRFCENLHAYSIKIGLDGDNYVVAEHVKLLSKLGEVHAIAKLFARVSKPDAFLYALTIAGYDVNGYRFEAVEFAGWLLRSSLSLSEGAVVSLFNLCGSIEESSMLHGYVLKRGHAAHLSASNALISAYADSGAMDEAEKLFEEMLERDVISWTAIMSGHTQNSRPWEAFRVFQTFRREGMAPDERALTAIVNACSFSRALGLGQQCHGLSVKLGAHFSEYLSSAVLHMYAKCGDVGGASAFFGGLHQPRGAVAVNVMLAGYAWNSLPEMAIELFCVERGLGFVPNEFSFAAVLGACGNLKLRVLGEQLHSCIIRLGFESFDVVVGNAMIKLYVKGGKVESARKCFYGMNSLDSSSYSAMISCYRQNGLDYLAMELFSQMHGSGLRGNSAAISIILKCCVDASSVRLGKQVHGLVLKTGFSLDSRILGSLTGIYAKPRIMTAVEKSRDLITWSSDIFVYLVRNMDEVWGYCQRLPEAVMLEGLQGKACGKALITLTDNSAGSLMLPWTGREQNRVCSVFELPGRLSFGVAVGGLFWVRGGEEDQPVARVQSRACLDLDEKPQLILFLCLNTLRTVSLFSCSWVCRSGDPLTKHYRRWIFFHPAEGACPSITVATGDADMMGSTSDLISKIIEGSGFE
ncbi:pentatricopeptide repeat-containing protein At2g33680-like [Wolffia australiana]